MIIVEERSLDAEGQTTTAGEREENLQGSKSERLSGGEGARRLLDPSGRAWSRANLGRGRGGDKRWHPELPAERVAELRALSPRLPASGGPEP